MKSFTILINFTLLLQKSSWIFNGISTNIRNILPIHYSSIPFFLSVSLGNPLAQFCVINKTCICSIPLCYWFTNYNFSVRNSTLSDLKHRCIWESRFWLLKESIIGVIFCVSLVVKLHIIKINFTTNSFMNCYICSILVILFFKIWGLWGMSNQMGWQ